MGGARGGEAPRLLPLDLSLGSARPCLRMAWYCPQCCRSAATRAPRSPDWIFWHRQQKQLSLDLESAFNSKEFADVQVECEGRVFDCHQVVLSSRSPVFRAMLLADMAEAKAKKVCCTFI